MKKRMIKKGDLVQHVDDPKLLGLVIDEVKFPQRRDHPRSQDHYLVCWGSNRPKWLHTTGDGSNWHLEDKIRLYKKA